MKYLIFGLLTFTFSYGKAQINSVDSTMQAIVHWTIGDENNYHIKHNKTYYSNGDSLSGSIAEYNINIAVRDSLEDGYMVEWNFSNYTSSEANMDVHNVNSTINGLNLVIRTNIMGVFQEVVNWESVKTRMEDTIKSYKKDASDPALVEAKKKLLIKFSTKENIESNAISDIKQFHTFYGNSFKYGMESIGKEKFTNNFGGPPFDVAFTVHLEELDFNNGSSVVRLYQQVNPEQLTNATYEFLKNSNQNMDLPKREEMLFTNEIWTASRIHSNTGWILFSIETKKISTNGHVTMDETTIELLPK